MPHEIEFHIDLADKPGYACRLLRKAYQRGLRVVVTGSADQLARLDAQLWTFDPDAFIPHARLRGAEQPAAPLAARTPIWFSDSAAAVAPADVLLNLGPLMPDRHEGFARVVELLGDDEADRRAGRERWRQYKAAGHLPRDMRQAPPAAAAAAAGPPAAAQAPAVSAPSAQRPGLNG